MIECQFAEPMIVIVMWLSTLFQQGTAAGDDHEELRVETLLQTSSSWDGEPYKSYSAGKPELTILKIIIAPHTKLEWHSHPIPNAAYILSGELTLKRKRDGKKQHFVAGQAVSETVDTLHRGITGNDPVVLIVFYAGISGTPLTQHLRAAGGNL
jgi:quercetin dioxygenase-like cupin family protein